MIAAEQVAKISAQVDATKDDRARVRQLVARGRWREAEDDVDRSKAYVTRQQTTSAMLPSGAEAIVGSTADFLSSSFLSEGAQVRRAVGYVEVNTPNSFAMGSGFLISPQLFITNQHVIEDAQAAQSAVIIFDREMDETGRARATTNFRLDPDAFAMFSPVGQLDYALIAVGARISGDSTLNDLGYCALADTPDRHVVGMNVNIIQHPSGRPKTVALRNNLLTHRTDHALLYETDTETGSSGSPVFNDSWDVVALHHWGSPFLSRVDANMVPLPLVNEGVRISAIVKDLRARMPQLPAVMRAYLEAALALGTIVNIAAPRALGGPRPDANAGRVTPATALPESANTLSNESSVASSSFIAQPEPVSMQGVFMNTISSNDDTIRITVPLEISVRFGGASGMSGAQAAKAVSHATPSMKTLTRASEVLKIDTDYSNRSGYDEKFIDGMKIALPALNAELKKAIAPLRGDEAGAASGLLNYEHFSLVLHKTRRMAIFTATNIDGATYLAVDRKTGQIGGGETEKWFKDMRVSDAFTLNQEFYSDWSHYFDRGHLTRRTDPTWGTEATAERANADTFHFANCSPQHFRFNQTAKFWQGAERYVLENGVLAAGTGKPISVFQGPIFNDAIDLWSDDVQIPSSFFKVIVWKAAAGLKSVGIIVDQLALMSETRKALGQPTALPNVDVSHWRVAIATIEQRTGLDFGKAVRDAETISASSQPIVGAEKAMLMRDMSDLLK